MSTVASVATVLVTGFTAWFGIRIFKHQRTSSDIKLALEIFSTINNYWDRINDSNSQHYNYDMGQIFAQFETAARLFNDSILTDDALPILKDHIVEIYTAVESSDEGKNFIRDCVSSPTTFSELRKFLKKHFSTALLAQKHDIEKSRQK
ncbi:hypothetical protein [Parasphingorhabdus sp.]|uniref:hypothetical protein n=1 Tax=Parasphingorhabdus sp. TaxID=2709688 RepID=UPI0032EAEBC9